MCEIVVQSDFLELSLCLSQLRILLLSHFLHSMLHKLSFLIQLSIPQVLLGPMLVHLAIEITLVVSLSHPLLQTFLFTFNKEFLSLILYKEFPDVKFLLLWST